MWLLSAVISVALHVTSNFVNALLVKRTPGYSDVSIWALTLMWCTRPRLAWLAVALIPREAVKAMYFQVAASAVMAESVLQLIGSYYMGLTAHYAWISHFYHIGGLIGAPREHNALAMYVGALMWLVAVTFGIFACTLSVSGINYLILTIGRAAADQMRSDVAASKLKTAMAEKQTGCNRIVGLPNESNTLASEWNSLIDEWSRLKGVSLESMWGNMEHDIARVTYGLQKAEAHHQQVTSNGTAEPPGSPEAWREVRDHWQRVISHWVQLKDAWVKVREANAKVQRKSIASRNTNPSTTRRLVIFGMMGCWTSQWLFWVGFVTLADDTYVYLPLYHLVLIPFFIYAESTHSALSETSRMDVGIIHRNAG
jgi:hypothetical protein